MNKSAAYWKKRQLRQMTSAQKSAGQVMKTALKAYNKALSDSEEYIKRVFAGFESVTKLSREDGMELINHAMQEDLVSDLLKLREQLTDKMQIRAVDNRINALAYGARINRLEAVKQNIYTAMKNAGIKEAAAGKSILGGIYKSGRNDVLEGLGVSFDVIPKRAVDMAIREKWHGKNYSQRVWKNTSVAAENAGKIIQSGLADGMSVQDMANQLKEAVGDNSKGALYRASRLIRTDASHYMNKGELEAYKEAQVEEYEYLAAHDACSDCAEWDGQKIKVEDAQEGVNYPPMHPNCRCTTVPVIKKR